MNLIQRLTELEAKATPGPWKKHPLATNAVHQPEFECWIPQTGHDAELTAEMRNALPDLLKLANAVVDNLTIETPKPVLDALKPLFWDLP